MTFGIWFEWGKKKELPLEVRLTIDRAIDFLAPYFGLSLNDDKTWDKIDLPEVEAKRFGGPSYNNGTIYLPTNISADNPSIGHEVAHWLHDRVNSDIYTVNDKVISCLLGECCADYGKLIWILKKDPFKRPKFKLIELANMSLDQARGIVKEITDFYFNKVLPKLIKNKN